MNQVQSKESISPVAQAAWTPSTVVEREVEYRRRQLMKHDWAALTLGAISITVVAVGGICLFVTFLGGIAAFVASVLLLIGLSYLARRIDQRRDRLQREAAEADQILSQEFGVGEGWLVDLRILQGSAPTGEDKGMLWFDEGRLVFSGHRTSFALSQDQVSGSCRYEASILGLRHSWQLQLTLMTEVGPVCLSLEPPLHKGDQMSSAINRWIEAALATTGQFPPTALGPGAASIDRLWLGMVLSGGFWIVLLFLTIRAPNLATAFFIIALGNFAGYILKFWFPFTRWKAWYDLKRLSP